MCYACWEEHGFPALRNERVDEMTKLLEKADPFGFLHVIVEDWNLGDDNVKFCRGLIDAGRPHTDDELRLLVLLEGATVAERASAMAHADGFVAA